MLEDGFVLSISGIFIEGPRRCTHQALYLDARLFSPPRWIIGICNNLSFGHVAPNSHWG